jgi:molybdate transport system regulatory protein
MSQFKIKSRIWIDSKDGMYLGEGRIALLDAIDQYGSISKAAKAMNMSYKKAWNLVDSMNSRGSELLVIRKTGGAGGGGAELSEAGRKAIEVYNGIKEANHQYLEGISNKIELG